MATVTLTFVDNADTVTIKIESDPAFTDDAQTDAQAMALHALGTVRDFYQGENNEQ